MPGPAPFEQVHAPSATGDASERTGSRLTFRLLLTAFVVAAMFVALVVRLYILQVQEGPANIDNAQASTTRVVQSPPPRGDIVARGGQELAGNVPTEQVTVDPSVIAAHPSEYTALASLLGVSAGSILEAVKTSTTQLGAYVPVVVPTSRVGVTEGDVTYIQENPQIFPGASAQAGYSRSYPYGALGSQLLGFLSEPTPGVEVGGSGLEAEYEAQLHGTPGTQQIYVNGQQQFVRNGTTKNPVAGDTVVLNLDLNLERTLTDSLTAQIEALRNGNIGGRAENAPFGSGIVMDNKGHVLAMVSLPGYDANTFVLPRSAAKVDPILRAATSPLINYATEGLQPPGSTFKIATATAALNTGLITAGTYVDDTGLFTYGTQQYTDSEGENLGYVNVVSAISKSSDYFFYDIGKRFWEQNDKTTPIQNIAREYGITEPSGIDLPNGTYPPDKDNLLGDEESLGQIDSPALRITQHAEDPAAFPNNSYQGGDNVDLAIGQGETVVTPLAMADAYEAFVNHGTRYAPELAGEILSPGPNPKVLKKIAPKVVGHVNLPLSTWTPMMEGFQGAVQDSTGTAYLPFSGFDFSSWNVAGKTGTADVVNASGTTAPTAWFIGFGGPVGSSTKYIVAVCIDQAGFGAEASAPVVRTIFDYLKSHGIEAQVSK